jgi:glutathione reductase (NADPH)
VTDPFYQSYDLIVIGAGSGGLACSKRAAGYGATVALIEDEHFGGTCVNVGCIPKKIMFNAAVVAETIDNARQYGFALEGSPIDWATLKRCRDRYINRLKLIHKSHLVDSKVDLFLGSASFIDHCTINVHSSDKQEDDVQLTAKHIVLAVGGKPAHMTIPGGHYAIDSDGFFALETQPQKVAIVGAGYIAVELAGILNSLGTDTTMFIREDQLMRSNDPMISAAITNEMKVAGLCGQHCVVHIALKLTW